MVEVSKSSCISQLSVFTLLLLHSCRQNGNIVTATKSSLIRSNRVLADGSVAGFDPIDVLGGPDPHGWVNSSNVDDQANLAFDLGLIYEEEYTSKKREVYRNGILQSEAITLKSLGHDAFSYSAKAPLFNYYTFAFREMGKDENQTNGYFDEQLAERYADSIVDDLFDIDHDTLSNSGIHKEAVVITGLWMRCYTYINEIVNLCRDQKSNVNTNGLIGNLDKAVALWIGRMQVHGDNSRGTMLYNLAERAGVNFAQDHGEVPVNRKLMDSWQFFKDKINGGICSDESNEDAYKVLYDEMNNIIRQMNIPLIQNLIHYITTGAKHERKFIELYALALYPQIISCDLSYIQKSYDVLVELADTEGEIDFMSIVSDLRAMYSCLGVTCNDIGAHSSGSACNDNEVDPIQSIAGYQPNSDVRRLVKFDRDLNQMMILLQQGNAEAAFDLYKFGKNANAVTDETESTDNITSLRTMAQHKGIDDTIDDGKRLYTMYERYFNGSNFADGLVSEQLQFGSYPLQTVPTMMKTIVIPQYAIRSFFAAYDACETNETIAETFWDRGAAVIAGSIEGESALGNEDHNGLSWLALGYEYCHIFHCGDGDFENPSYRKKMIDKVKFGRDYIRSGRCSSVHNLVIEMESLLITPLLQGLLYHSHKLSILRSDEQHALVFAYGMAVIPFLQVASKEDASIIKESLYSKNIEFNESHAKMIWIAIALSISDLGIDCMDVGKDTYGILDKDVSFCDLVDTMTQFPTPAPVPTVEPLPTLSPTPEPTSNPTPTSQVKSNEINPALHDFFSDIDNATATAKIALDVKEIISMRGDIESELLHAKSVYTNGSHSYTSLQSIAKYAETTAIEDPIYIFYRDAFRDNDLFNYSMESLYNFADTVVTDAFETAKDIALASEAIVVMIIFMRISHDLSVAVNKCRDAESSEATYYIENAFALYVGTGQTIGGNDGYLFYNFAQRVASNYELFSNQEVEINSAIRNLFNEAKEITTDIENVCGPSTYGSLRQKVGLIISAMNLSLVRQFLFLLEENAYATEQTNYLELFGLTVLPQIKTCQPSNFEFLTREITDNGLNLDPAKTKVLVEAFQKSYSCFGLTCEQVRGKGHLSCLTLGEDKLYAGFSTNSSVMAEAQLDRSVLKIAALISEGANSEAMRHYDLGDMIKTHDSSSLKNLAEQQSSVTNQLFKTYLDHYDDINELNANIIEGNSPFDNFSTKERAEVIVKAMQTMLFVQAGMSSLFIAAYDDCSDGKLLHWDRAMAYLIGSIEGQNFGGDSGNNGVSIYGLSKEMCDSFNVCTGSNDAQVNVHLLAAFSKGQDLISSKSCAELTTYVEQRIMPLILVPLIQATIKYADENKPAIFHVIGRAISPFLELVSPQAAITIKHGSTYNGVYIDGITTMTAFNETLSKLWVDCTDVGYSVDLKKGMCDLIDSQQEQSYSLADGLYVTTTFVESSAKMAEDVEFIEMALNRGDIDQAKGYYQNGLFSFVYDENGKWNGVQSLRDFSTLYSSAMVWEPVFNLYQYAFTNVQEFKEDPRIYADTITSSFFNQDDIFLSEEKKKNSKTLAVESAVALNLWGMIVHLLYETVRKCENDDFNNKSEGIHNIDKAVALWIGSKQATGDQSTGYLLYRLAEQGADIFDTEYHDRQARANRNILRLFQEAALQLSFQGACYSGNTFITSQLRYIVDRLVSQMTVPLIQHLIYNLEQNDEGRVVIYGHAFVPLVAACDKSTYNYLHEKLISKNYERSEVTDIIRAIQSTYSCLNLKCSDIGEIDGVPKCSNRSEFEAFGGYTPVSDVREFLDIDFDIRFIEIMLEQGAFDAAEEIYRYGKHAVVMTDIQKEPISLRTLATSSKRTQVPSFSKFSSFFGGNDNYADFLIIEFLQGRSSLPGSHEQQKQIIVKTLQYQVTFMAALQRIYEAISFCKSSTQAQALQAVATWDVGAALMVGSMMRVKDFVASNQNDGYLLFGLGKDLCSEFNTCDEDSFEAKSNLNILDALYSGSFELEQKSCGSVLSKAYRIESQLLVPLIQGTLHSAFLMSQPNSDNTDAYAAGDVYSRAILPFIHVTDENAARIIDEYMSFKATNPVIDATAVFNAMSRALDKLDMKITCDDIGFMTAANRDFCTNTRSTSDGSTMRISLLITATLTPFFINLLL